MTFADDFMFGKVMQDREICAGVIERLLGIKVGKIKYPKLQKVIAPYYSTHGVRLDVYVENSTTVFDVEIQTTPVAALGKRMRYYQGMIDIDHLTQGNPYDVLKESYVLFLCKKVPYKEKRSVYKFERTSEGISAGDNSHWIVYNLEQSKEESDASLRAFMEYVGSGNSTENDALVERIAHTVEKLKRNELFRDEYRAMNLHDYDKLSQGRAQGRKEGIALGRQEGITLGRQEGIAQGLQKGMAQGRQEGILMTARGLIEIGLSLEQITKVTGLSLEQVTALKEKK